MDNQNCFIHELFKKDSPKKLTPIPQLLKESWRIYCLKIKTLLGIVGVPIGFSFFFWILKYFLSNTPIKYSLWFSIIELISSLFTFFLWLLAIPSLLYSLKENTGTKDSFKKGLKIFFPYLWIYFLLNVIIAGAFLIFIIPGILFFIWFSLAIFILVFEEKRGFSALFRSKDLIKGNFWKILARFLVLFLILILVGLPLAFLSTYFTVEKPQTANRMIEIGNYIFQLFILPFIFVYGFLIYSDLKEIKAEIPYKEPTKSKKIIYALPGILGTLILGLLVSVYLLNIFWGRDIPPIDDSDLWLSKVEIPKEENAFYLLEQAGKKMYLPLEKRELFFKMAEGKEWDDAFAEELVTNNEEVFQLLEEAINLPYFQLPGFEDPKKVDFTTSLPDLARLREIARLNSIKSRYLLVNGNEQEALDFIFKTIKMGQIIENSPRPPLISYLVGKAIKEEGLKGLILMLPHLTLSPEILKNYINQLEEFKANEEGLIKVIKMEYILFTNTKKKIIDEAFIGRGSKKELEEVGIIEEPILKIKKATELNYLYKPNQTQKIFAEKYRNFINNVNKDCYETGREAKSLALH